MQNNGAYGSIDRSIYLHSGERLEKNYESMDKYALARWSFDDFVMIVKSEKGSFGKF